MTYDRLTGGVVVCISLAFASGVASAELESRHRDAAAWSLRGAAVLFLLLAVSIIFRIIYRIMKDNE